MHEQGSITRSTQKIESVNFLFGTKVQKIGQT